MNDFKISGAGRFGGGEFNNVKISGSGRVDGDLVCESFGASGSARICGSIKCKGFACSGATKVEGNVECDGRMALSGSSAIGGTAHTDELRSSGALSAGKGVIVRELRASGTFEVTGDVSAEKAQMSGRVKITGLLNAESVEIALTQGARCEIDQIGGNNIEIKYLPHESAVFRLFGSKEKVLARVSSIEADTVNISCAEVGTVRAIDCIVVEDCVIDTVEYSGTLTVSETATIKNIVKL